jgi:hypothetical protein
VPFVIAGSGRAEGSGSTKPKAAAEQKAGLDSAALAARLARIVTDAATGYFIPRTEFPIGRGIFQRARCLHERRETHIPWRKK